MYNTSQKLIAEFLGTFALVFVGVGAACTDHYLQGSGGIGLFGIDIDCPNALTFGGQRHNQRGA